MLKIEQICKNKSSICHKFEAKAKLEDSDFKPVFGSVSDCTKFIKKRFSVHCEIFKHNFMAHDWLSFCIKISYV